MTKPLPILLEPDKLHDHLSDPSLVIVDLRDSISFSEGHIPGAVFLEPKKLITESGSALGMLPEIDQLENIMRSIGLETNHHVVAYDDEGGGWACRLLWTLDVIGHPSGSLLNGGLRAWKNMGLSLASGDSRAPDSGYQVRLSGAALASKDDILSRLGDPTLALLDARSPAEYDGSKVRATKGGHIPGAVNLNWTDTMDTERDLRFLPPEQLLSMLNERNITRDKEVITYCHTHHRSSHSYIMLKQLGYEKIKGYAGSWSEWGNDPDTPTEL